MKNSNTINVLYDGNCPFWVRMARLVRRLDRSQIIHLTNIADRKFEARIYNRSQNELTADLHVQLPDGTWLKGSDAFRELFSKTRLRPVVLVSGLPLIRQLSNTGYRILINTLPRMRRPEGRQGGSHAAVSTTLTSGSVIQH